MARSEFKININTQTMQLHESSVELEPNGYVTYTYGVWYTIHAKLQILNIVLKVVEIPCIGLI